MSVITESTTAKALWPGIKAAWEKDYTLSVEPPFVAIDVETTMNAPTDLGASHPMHPDNRIVAFGSCGVHSFSMGVEEYEPTEAILEEFFHYLFSDSGIVGINLPFDLLYLYRNKEVKRRIQQFWLWDIQVVEYIITGQRTKFASLDQLCETYGLPVKDAEVTEYFKAGIGADKVPKDKLLKYLKMDVDNTLEIAKKQYRIVVEQNQLALVQSQMESLHATIEMMFNGIHVDTDALDKYTLATVDKYADAKVSLEKTVPEVTNIDSAQQWSRYFFGGTTKEKIKEEDGTYKNGKPKYKTVEVTVEHYPHTVYIPPKDKTSDKTGVVSVDVEVLESILETERFGVHLSKPALSVVESLIDYRGLSKQLNTYVIGLGKHLIGNKIHGNINHAATGTGRLASSNPNLQNISNNDIKQIFVSRFEEGVLVEVDFNQLEIVALACITEDRQLIADIRTGTDIHTALYEGLYKRTPTKEERKAFKPRTFQLIYGAGATGIAKSAKCSTADAVQFIKVFYDRYPGVKAWHDKMLADASKEGTHLLAEVARTYTYIAPTGRRLKFVEYANTREYDARKYNFSPTELKNYPVQSLATGDIVPMMLGVLFRKFVNNEKVLMINTIHDSVLFDVQADYAVDFMEEVLGELRQTHLRYEEVFKKTLPISLNASASYGFNWYDMKESEL